MGRRVFCRWCSCVGADPGDLLHSECRLMHGEYRRRLEDRSVRGGSILPDEWFVGKTLVQLFSWFDVLTREEDGVFREREAERRGSDETRRDEAW